MDEPLAVTCPACKLILGNVINADGVSWLRLENGLLVSSAYGKCFCGAEWHWKQSDPVFERLMAHYENEGKGK